VGFEERVQQWGQRLGAGCRRCRFDEGVRLNHLDAIVGDAESTKHVTQFFVDANEPIEPPKHEAARAPVRRRFTDGRAGVSAGMKRQDRPNAGNQRTNECKSHQPHRQVAAEVEVQNVVVELEEQPHEFACVVRIVNLVVIGAAVSCDVDYRTRHLPPKQVLANRHEVRLHAAVGRRVRAQQENPHEVGASP